jgi:hypothetical protein
MTEAVVDLLKVVEIDEQRSRGRADSPCLLAYARTGMARPKLNRPRSA